MIQHMYEHQLAEH